MPSLALRLPARYLLSCDIVARLTFWYTALRVREWVVPRCTRTHLMVVCCLSLQLVCCIATPRCVHTTSAPAAGSPPSNLLYTTAERGWTHVLSTTQSGPCQAAMLGGCPALCCNFNCIIICTITTPPSSFMGLTKSGCSVQHYQNTLQALPAHKLVCKVSGAAHRRQPHGTQHLSFISSFLRTIGCQCARFEVG